MSTIKFGLSVKIRSIQDDEFSRRCAGSDINCCDSCDIVSDSIWGPLWDVWHGLKAFQNLQGSLQNSVTDWPGKQ